MSQANRSAKVIRIHHDDPSLPAHLRRSLKSHADYLEAVERAKRQQIPAWKHHLSAVLVCLLVIVAAVTFVAIVGAMLTAFMITGGVALVVVGMLGAVGWLIRRLP